MKHEYIDKIIDRKNINKRYKNLVLKIKQIIPINNN